MPKGIKTVTVARIKAADYKIVADNFYNGALVAAEYEYWNAAGVLIVHAAIAYGDALTIKYGGIRNRGEDHQQIVSLIEKTIKKSEHRKKAMVQLNRIIAHKNDVSYYGDVYEYKDIQKLKTYIERFKFWAESLL